MTKLVILAIAFPVYLVSVVVAVASYRSTSTTTGFLRKLIFRAPPYAIAIIVALLLANTSDSWHMVVLEAAFYVALTWVLVWGVRKQWY